MFYNLSLLPWKMRYTGEETQVSDAGGGEVEMRYSPVSPAHLHQPMISHQTSNTL